MYVHVLPFRFNVRPFLFKIRKVTLIEGDGIGPEISDSVKKIFSAAQVCIMCTIMFYVYYCFHGYRSLCHGNLWMFNQSKWMMDVQQYQTTSSYPCRRIKLDSKVTTDMFYHNTLNSSDSSYYCDCVGPLKTQIGKGAVSLNLTLRR